MDGASDKWRSGAVGQVQLGQLARVAQLAQMAHPKRGVPWQGL